MLSREAIKVAKKLLRVKIKHKLATISQESLSQQSQEILNRLVQSPIFKNAQKVALFMNMPDLEVKTLPIIQECYNQKKEVYLPRCNTISVPNRKRNYLSMLNVPTFQDILELRPQGKYQLLEPIEGKDALDSGDLDLILMPGVAFNQQRERLGHGAGFYDEYLYTYKTKWEHLPLLVGLALEEQITTNGLIPVELHDFKLDQIITPSNTFTKVEGT